MPHNKPKKLRKFLAARQHRLRRPDSVGFFMARLTAEPAAVFRIVRPPLIALALYLVCLIFAFFTPLKAWPHYAALGLLLLWFLFALRGAALFWPRWGHLRFAVPFLLLVGFGSSWGFFGPVPAKVWMTPPAYARLPSVALGDSERGKRSDVIAGSFIHISQSDEEPSASASFGGVEKELEDDGRGEAVASFTVPEVSSRTRQTLVLRRGWHRIGLWRFRVLPDVAPHISFTEEPEVTIRKTMRFAFDASDDYGVQTVLAQITPIDPAPGVPSAPVEIALASPSVQEAHGAGYADLTALPWAGGSVSVQLVAVDGAGHKSYSEPKVLVLPTRSFRNPFARALIEERQKLLGNPDPSTRDEAANVMAGIARQQGLYRGDPVVMMSLRSGAVRLVLNNDAATVSAIQNILWQTAIRLEEGAVGLARTDLAVAERDLSSALLRLPNKEDVAPYLTRMQQALRAYFEALDVERARQPSALQHMEWPLAMTSETLTPEDLQNRMATIEPLLNAGAYKKARARLDELQALIENLRTTPPELTPDQFKLVQQTSSLRSLVRGQQSLLEETESLIGQETKTAKGRKRMNNGRARLLSQQQLLLSALRDVAGKIEPPSTSMLEAKAGEKAMRSAITALQQKNLATAQQWQAEALALMENSLLALSERMRQSLTARAP